MQCDARATLRGKNLVALAASFPQVHAAVERHRPSRPVHALKLARVPWVLRCAKQPPVETADYFVLMQEQGPELRQLNLPRSPVPLYELIRKLQDRHSAHVLVGSLRSPELFLNVMRNRITVPVPNYVQSVYALEPDLDVFSALLDVYDLVEVFGGTGLVLHVGASAMQDLVDCFARRPDSHPAAAFPSRRRRRDTWRRRATAPSRRSRRRRRTRRHTDCRFASAAALRALPAAR